MLNLTHQYLIDWSTTISMFVVIIMFLFLFESRYPKKKYFASLIPFSICWLGLNLGILFVCGIEVQGTYSLLTATLPSLIYFFIVAKDRGGRFFFTFCFVDTIMIWVMMVTGLIDYAVGSEGIVNFVLRMIAFSAMLPITWFWGRKRYLKLLRTASKGWWIFTAMTGIFYITLTVMGGIPTNLRLRPEDMPSAVMVLILLPLTYITIVRLLGQQQANFEMREHQKVFEIQTSMMEQRAFEFRAAEQKIRIERHDLRHRFQTLSTMLKNGQTDEALEYIGAAEEALSETDIKHYCSNPVLDAILLAYFSQAKELGIRVEANLDIPDTLPVPAADLSTVFANALENMINAVKELPVEQRVIFCKCISTPCMMIEFSNPYEREVEFSSDGLPVSEKNNHGIGTHSIKAFADKYDAICSFKAENKMFKLQLAIKNQET